MQPRIGCGMILTVGSRSTAAAGSSDVRPGGRTPSIMACRLPLSEPLGQSVAHDKLIAGGVVGVDTSMNLDWSGRSSAETGTSQTSGSPTLAR